MKGEIKFQQGNHFLQISRYMTVKVVENLTVEDNFRKRIHCQVLFILLALTRLKTNWEKVFAM